MLSKRSCVIVRNGSGNLNNYYKCYSVPYIDVYNINIWSISWHVDQAGRPPLITLKFYFKLRLFMGGLPMSIKR